MNNEMKMDFLSLRHLFTYFIRSLPTKQWATSVFSIQQIKAHNEGVNLPQSQKVLSFAANLYKAYTSSRVYI